MQVIQLTAEQADMVRGPTSNNSALSPVPYNGVYILGIEVIADANHAMHHEFLQTLPIVELDTNATED